MNKSQKIKKIKLTVKTSKKSCSKTKKSELKNKDKLDTMTPNILKKAYGKKMPVIKQGLLMTTLMLPV